MKPAQVSEIHIFSFLESVIVKKNYHIILTLKAPRKKCRLLKSSAANNCLTLLSNFSIKANSVDPDQTAP